MHQNQNSTAKDRFKPILRATLRWSLPVWVFLAADVILMLTATGILFTRLLILPGLVVLLLLDPSWAGMHNFSLLGLWVGNSVFYSIVLFVVACIKYSPASMRRREDMAISGRNSTIMKRALILALPVWACLIADTALEITLQSGLIPLFIYYPGLLLTAFLSAGMQSLDEHSLVTVCSNSCLFFYLAILLILYVKGKIPTPSKE